MRQHLDHPHEHNDHHTYCHTRTRSPPIGCQERAGRSVSQFSPLRPVVGVVALCSVLNSDKCLTRKMCGICQFKSLIDLNICNCNCFECPSSNHHTDARSGILIITHIVQCIIVQCVPCERQRICCIQPNLQRICKLGSRASSAYDLAMPPLSNDVPRR